ncbi:ABC transporter substrate-binding protein [Tropicibacter naphthalenivorans]|uniref:ABC-type thiamine transport system, periplasmic component n=1 Tax=Tropicibacter naphthalenivorans TaxID=441103 RepID=A0A0P1GZN4_9RHOB|nr:extracellular solute-binding protein [Tropicibacter naphthalenivorans]CUH82040.1 ABC-type thiamine transport system, periplasmic component [Tropicibacter naphthalenivorans]SMD08290.1 iron(III) transport system substrate-binding protein [Tropicibacter naphthalenivorans]
MIRALALLLMLTLALPARAQEAVAVFTAPGVDTDAAAGTAPGVSLIVRSTTDIAILAPALTGFVTRHPQITIRYEQWGSNALYADSLRACEGDGPGADVVISSGVHQMVDLVNRACAQPYRSPLTDALPDTRKWRNEIWGITQEAAVTIYNSALVPAEDVPQSRFALLDLMRRSPLRYRGKIATYDIQASGLGFLFAFMDSQAATTFGGLLEGFSRVNAVATCCSAEIIQGVAEGRYLMAYNVLGSYVASAPQANIGIIHPTDYTLFLSRALVIPRGAANAQGAALFLDYLLSPEGRRALTEANLIQQPDREDTSLPESARRFISIDPTTLVAMDRHRQLNFIAKWRGTFGQIAP